MRARRTVSRWTFPFFAGVSGAFALCTLVIGMGLVAEMVMLP